MTNTSMQSMGRRNGMGPSSLQASCKLFGNYANYSFWGIYLVALPGLEPGLFALRGRRVNQLHHNAMNGWGIRCDLLSIANFAPAKKQIPPLSTSSGCGMTTENGPSRGRVS